MLLEITVSREECGLEPFSYLDVSHCPECGKEVIRDRRWSKIGRPRKFCSDECRQRYWRKQQEQSASLDEFACPACGRTFAAIHENKRQRKFCSRACANKGRTLKRKEAGHADETEARMRIRTVPEPR